MAHHLRLLAGAPRRAGGFARFAYYYGYFTARRGNGLTR